MSSFPKNHRLDYKDRIFIAIVKLAIKEKDKEFLIGTKVQELGEYLGVHSNGCQLVQERFNKKFITRKE